MDACRRKTPQRKRKKKKKIQVASRSSVVCEDQLLCPICLDVFVQPATTPCGHNFCRSCLSSYWAQNPSTCPVCKEHFPQKPDLKVNTCISELVQQFHSLQVCPETEAKPEVFCDICTESRHEAVTSCVECMASYCESHLEPHRRVPGLKRHKLIQPQANLDKQVCQEHNQVLALYCKDDKVLLCNACSAFHDASHETVHLQKAYEEIKAGLEQEETRVHAVLEDNIQKVNSFIKGIQQEKDDTKNVIANSAQALNAVISKLRKTHADMVKTLKDEQEERNEMMESTINWCQEDIASDKVTETKIKQLKEVKDPLTFLQTYSTLAPVSGLGLSVSHQSLQDTRKRVKISLQTLTDRIDEEIAMIPHYFVNVKRLRFLMFLDPETAHPRLTISSDRLEVRLNIRSPPPPIDFSPKRFDAYLFVLSSSGIHVGYFEVFVGNKSEWILGMAEESMQRKGRIPRVPGRGIWALWFKMNRFETYCCPGVAVCVGKVERVGVYVNCGAGMVSFFDVDNGTLIYSFADCDLPDDLRAILNPCDNEFGNNLGPMRSDEVCDLKQN